MKALLIGATGLVGSEILQLLLASSDCEQVRVFTRRPTQVQHPKFIEDLISFDDVASWSSKLEGDVLFLSLGTTLKAAGSQEAQYKVDFTYQFEVARAAKQNQVGCCVLVSSMNADSKSRFFYLKMKGELEDEVQKLHFPRTRIVRPGPLTGPRQNPRRSEQILTGLLQAIPPFLVPDQMKPVAAEQVAKVCVKASRNPQLGLIEYAAEQVLKDPAMS